MPYGRFSIGKSLSGPYATNDIARGGKRLLNDSSHLHSKHEWSGKLAGKEAVGVDGPDEEKAIDSDGGARRWEIVPVRVPDLLDAVAAAFVGDQTESLRRGDAGVVLGMQHKREPLWVASHGVCAEEKVSMAAITGLSYPEATSSSMLSQSVSVGMED